MGVSRDWVCHGHGVFESSEEAPLCPEGCDTVEKIYLTPAAFRSGRTKNIDKTFESLAKSHGLTDMNNRGGKAAVTQSWQARDRNEQLTNVIRERYGDGWGNVPKGSSQNARTGQVTGGEGPGTPGALAAYRARPGNAFADPAVKQALATPKPILVRRDHENLKVDVSKAPR